MTTAHLGFDEATALALLDERQAGRTPVCPACQSPLTFSEWRDETPFVKWMVTCQNLRCQKQGTVELRRD